MLLWHVYIRGLEKFIFNPSWSKRTTWRWSIGGVLSRGVVNLSCHPLSRWGQQWTPRVVQLGGESTSELLSMSHDGLPLVLPTARGRTFPTMGGGRTRILDGDLKDGYLESHCFRKCGQIAIATTCILFGQKQQFS